MKITKNTVVTMEYTLKNEEGKVLDTSEGREPLTYLHGVGGLIPGLENELEGCEAEDQLNVEVQPEDGYGKRRDDLIHVVSKDGFQGDEEMKPGMQVQLQTENGPMVASITKIEDNDVTLDLNHPLADTTLHFDVQVSSVREATKEELEHGHTH